MPRKKITANDIPAKFRFILEMYGALERFVKNYNESDWNFDRTSKFKLFVIYAFNFHTTRETLDYWYAIATQNEPEIIRQTQILKERGV